MNSPTRKLILAAAVSLVALMTFAATASAHGGPGRGHRGGGYGLGRVGVSALVTQAAKELDVTRAKLVDAIRDSAVARINEAVEDGDLEAEYAADLKEEAQDNLGFAYRVSRTRTVASNLGVTTAKLNTEFRTARKALILARINDAVEEGDLDADDAAALKDRLDDAELPGYKASGFGK